MSEFPREDEILRPVPDASDSSFARIGRYTQALRRIKSKILTGVEVDVVLQAVCSEIAAVVPDADLVGITMLDDSGRPRTVASTDSVVHDIDSDQYRTDQGPCLEAMRSGHMVRAQAREAGIRWPRFAAAVADLGVHSYLAAPLTPDEHRHGSLNIYGRSNDGFDRFDEISVALFATSIETAVAISERTRSAEQELTGLRTAMRTRADIDQAKGIVMAMRGISADEAFALLSEQSQNRNIKVSDIAAAMIDSVAEQTASHTTENRTDQQSGRSTSSRGRSKPGHLEE
ncbi:ANTAR domain-containing protein [Rhodococcus fascians]|nr:ANTAR domain-containing protein [Rhodococcus fascians]MBY3995117.1 ANTAR domain-containing protein [Rhodococcus fascians]MBY4000563.1 ANTAR domain-containing protein [Rhodococcus fascians]MBY4005591.1 ANTAR domain-containing protein [Rhodococcus fascians]MBY4016424.1 ANTAR domain-containing protein [Rhodococcus fascians]